MLIPPLTRLSVPNQQYALALITGPENGEQGLRGGGLLLSAARVTRAPAVRGLLAGCTQALELRCGGLVSGEGEGGAIRGLSRQRHAQAGDGFTRTAGAGVILGWGWWRGGGG